MLSTMGVALALLAGPLVGMSVAQSEDSGQTDTADSVDAGFVEIFEVSGLLDDIVADALEDAIRGANADSARALVLTVNSKQAVVSDERLNELAALIVESPVPVAVWVGPSGSRVAGKVAQLVGVADTVGVAIGAKLGPAGPQALDQGRYGAVWGENAQLVGSTALTWEQAIDAGIVPCERLTVDELGNALTPDESLARCSNPTVGDFLVGLDTFDSSIVNEGEGPRLQPDTRVRFRSLSLLDQLMHTVASPPVAYLMLVIGLALIVFEFYSIGVGVAGAIGAVFLAFGGYGMAVLPIRTWALVLIAGSFLAFCIDIQVAVPRAWTFIGMTGFVVGTLGLYPQGDVSMSWIPITVAVVGIGIAMFRGMPIMVRGRFSTTAIPRDFLVDQIGSVVDAESDPAVVEVRGVRWRATSNVPLKSGDSVVVDAVNGLELEVSSPS